MRPLRPMMTDLSVELLCPEPVYNHKGSSGGVNISFCKSSKPWIAGLGGQGGYVVYRGCTLPCVFSTIREDGTRGTSLSAHTGLLRWYNQYSGQLGVPHLSSLGGTSVFGLVSLLSWSSMSNLKDYALSGRACSRLVEIRMYCQLLSAKCAQTWDLSKNLQILQISPLSA